MLIVMMRNVDLPPGIRFYQRERIWSITVYFVSAGKNEHRVTCIQASSLSKIHSIQCINTKI